jgi:bisphosphoglycerate-independent phosphoglycerate mutase (AlkP superfamily)
VIYEKVFPATGYKSAALLNLQNKVVHKMRRNKFLGGVVSWFKQKGISDRLKKLNTVEKPYNAIDEEDAIMLYNFYKEDMQALSRFVKKNYLLNNWNFAYNLYFVAYSTL